MTKFEQCHVRSIITGGGVRCTRRKGHEGDHEFNRKDYIVGMYENG